VAEPEIPIGVVGRILAGPNAGWYLRVDDDADHTGGFLVLQSSRPFDGAAADALGYDDWIERREDLARFIAHRGWVVSWPQA
jgi:hypothetical protein